MLYQALLEAICKKHGIMYHLYANDQYIYLSFKLAWKGSKENCLEWLEKCIKETSTWMTHNLLKLNEEKTEIIQFGIKQQCQIVRNIILKVGGAKIKPLTSVQNLCYFMDCYIKTPYHINRLYSQLYGSLRRIQHTRTHLDEDSAKIIVPALILSKIYCCKILLADSAEYQLDKLQRIQNIACRIVLKLRKFYHISDHLKVLHWLKICERIAYKIPVLVFKCKCNLAP